MFLIPVEEECTSDKNLYEAYLMYKEARDTLNQVRRERGFCPVIAIPAPVWPFSNVGCAKHR